MSVEKDLFSILHYELSDSGDNSRALETTDIAHIVAAAYSKASVMTY